MPERIQLRRTKGWRMPPNTVKVDRSTRWGNQFYAGDYAEDAKALTRELPTKGERERWMREMAAEAFAEWIRDEATAEWKAAARTALRGKNLACWCPKHNYCHADVLIELANTR